ncbi:hypothetical protein ACU19_02890 [Actinobaculum suis]|nr:DUF1617 family protein [Actinobaculum suis]KMY23623.1 hypothetical protein ACU19_02890 [Actinobaculum suis]
MRLLIPNRHLASIATLLEGMVLKPAQSRARSKLLDLVEEAQMRFGKDEYDLVTHHATLDGEGKPIIGEDGTFQLAQGTDAGEFLRLRDELLDSLAEVEGPTYATHLPDITRLLAEYDEPLSGQAAAAYSVLFDAVEAAHAADDPNKEGDQR